jgi:ubiquitin-protein ligase E3 C
MHQSFTGSTRRSRQVNLSGRNTTNPWAALPGSGKSGLGGKAASHDPVAQAQAERVKRQQERDRLHATKKIQKVWRGHNSRRQQKAAWRYLWDENERQRLGQAERPDYWILVEDVKSIPAYETLDQLLSQLRVLLRYQDFRQSKVRDEEDTLRLVYFGEALHKSLLNDHNSLHQETLASSWKHLFAKLGLITARHLQSVISNQSSSSSNANGRRLLSMIMWLAYLRPEGMLKDSAIYFTVIDSVLRTFAASIGWQEAAVDAIVALLRVSEDGSQDAYDAFIAHVLGRDSLARDTPALTGLADELDMDLLAKSITTRVLNEEETTTAPLDSSQHLYQLAYLVFMHGSRSTKKNKKPATQSTYVEAISALLSKCANDVAQKLDLADSPMFGDGSDTSVEPLPTFIRENVSKLSKQENIHEILLELASTSSGRADHQDSDFGAARRLANYALAVLTAFPSKAREIRMLLHRGSFTFGKSGDMSIIQYFWATTRHTAVFMKVVENHRSVMSILREAAPETNQIGQEPISSEQIALWRDEWKITILFLELYGFILKIMDDNEFFSLSKSNTFGAASSTSTFFSRKGALPLEDVATMTTFLKNLAFSLYWYAADLVETNDVEEEANISALFGRTNHAPPRPSETKMQTLTGNGLSQAYLKGLVTGLLRQLHERDSRQSFVPANHWLMTDQVNMTGFIPSVVAEEERRHELNDDEDVDETGPSLDETVELGDPIGSDASEALLSSMFGIRQPHAPRNRASRQAEMIERQRSQARKKRQIESLAPRLEILRNLPFFIPFETRVQIFREFIFRDQLRRRGGAIDPDTWRMSVASSTQGRTADGRPRGLDVISRHHAEIHRESVFEDAFDAFQQLGDGLKEPIQITFIDKFGQPEAGIDGGGVTKEFLMSVTTEAFDPDGGFRMFKENSQRYLFPNPLVYDETAEYLKKMGRQPHTPGFTVPMGDMLRRFQFLGRVVGKCLYEGILIDVIFAGFFLLKWALTGGTTVGSNESAYRPTINDLREYDEELYQGLLKLKNYSGDVETDFSLDFTVTDTLMVMDHSGKESPQTVTKELRPGGTNIPVTNLNRLDYIDRMVRHKLLWQPKQVTDAFLSGLGQIIQPMWLAMFNQKELQKLVGGDNSELDIADLRRNTQYGGLYVLGNDGVEHPTVRLFWKALQEMDDADRRRVLKFVTSTPRAPLLGFSHLNPKFSIRDSSEDQTRLPSTSTCVNLLKLPRYGDLKTMKDKLLYAVNAGAGFDLS